MDRLLCAFRPAANPKRGDVRSSRSGQEPIHRREAAGRTGCRRPLQLTLFVLWLLGLAAASLWRGLTLWRTRALLAELGSPLSPPWLVLFVVLSMLVGVGLVLSAWGLWQRREWGRLSARATIVLYMALVQSYTWLFVRSGLLWERRWVSLILALGTVGISFGILTWHRSRRWLGLQ